MSKGKIEKLSVHKILEGKLPEPKKGAWIQAILEDTKLKEKSKAGTWVDDELIVSTYPLNEFVKRIVYIGYDFAGASKMKYKLERALPDIIKGDRNFARAIIDIMADKEASNSEKADLIDASVDDFIAEHSKELSLFKPYQRPPQ